jgi:Icc-related predicted phosphoesterase
VTHHAPHPNSIPERYRQDILSGAFASDLTRLLGRSRLWVHGHMHDCMDYEVSGARVVCNPRGYLRRGVPENEGLDPFAIFQIGDRHHGSTWHTDACRSRVKYLQISEQANRGGDPQLGG